MVLTLEGTTPETSMTVQVKDTIISDDDIISINCLNFAMCTNHLHTAELVVINKLGLKLTSSASFTFYIQYGLVFSQKGSFH